MGALLSACAIPYRADRSTRTLKVYQGRVDGLVLEVKWRDTARGGGAFVLSDPKLQSVNTVHKNQPDLGGGSFVRMGESSMTTDPQASGVVSALGTAVGNVVGAAAKSAAGLP